MNPTVILALGKLFSAGINKIWTYQQSIISTKAHLKYGTQLPNPTVIN